MFDIAKVRSDFLVLSKMTGGKQLIYFDNAATTQKPKAVIEAITQYYETSNANVHRGIYDLSEGSTRLYEEAREKTAKFINAKSEREIIFVRNTTEALNLLAFCLKPKAVTTTIMEHHSNFLPWKRATRKLKIVDIDEEGNLLDFKKEGFLGRSLLTLTHASNVLGTINKIPKGEIVIVDGAQAVGHFKVDMQKLGCSAYAFSGHKMFGPQGIGVLYVKEELLKTLPPFLLGGGMYGAEYPWKFEAGTPDIAGAVGLGAAIDYIERIGYSRISNFEFQISNFLIEGLKKIPEVTIYGSQNPKNQVPVVSFSIRGIHPHDVAQFLNDKYNIAVRAGHHCAMPLHERLGIKASIRASLAFYNTEEEVEIFQNAIKDLIWTFTRT